MSTILIDRRTAALLGELAAAPARTGARRATAVDGVSLGVAAPGRAAKAPRRSGGRPTRRAGGPVPTNSEKKGAVTIRTATAPAAAEARLRRRLRCEPAAVAERQSKRRGAVTTGSGRATRATGALHLTRRGRLVAVLLLLAVLTVAFSFGRVTSTAVGTAGGSSAEVIVQRGDTLWSIAERIAPNKDPRSTAADLMAVNGLGSPSLEVGQHLRLP